MTKIDYLRFRRLAGEGAWILFGQGASVFGALVLIRVLTEYLGPEEYGKLALGLTIAGLVNQVVMGGVSVGIGRYYSIAAEKKELHNYFLASKILMGLSTIAVVAISLIFITGSFLLDFSQWIGVAVATFVFSILSGYNSCLIGIENAARQRATVAFHTGLDSWLKIFLSIAFILWLGSFGTAVVLGYALSTLIVTCSQYFLLQRQIESSSGKIQLSKSWIVQIWAYSWPFSVFGAFTWMQQVSDRWALQAFVSQQEVGLYAVLFQLGYVPIGLLAGMVVNFIGPILYHRSGDVTDLNRNSSVHRIAWQVTSVCLFITALTFFLTLYIHKQIFQLVVSVEYHVVSNFLPWMVLAGGIYSAGQMLSLKLMSEMKTSAMTSVKIVTATLGVALNIYGAFRFGLQGVVIAMLIFSTIYFLWMAWISQRPPQLDL
jgi:O-antigen/teichoic acid export membrane protein